MGVSDVCARCMYDYVCTISMYYMYSGVRNKAAGWLLKCL